VLEWFKDRGYRFVIETRTDLRDRLFDGMFPEDLVRDALELSLHHDRTTLVGFAHDADPIWVVYNQATKEGRPSGSL